MRPATKPRAASKGLKPRSLRDEIGKHGPFESPEQEAYLNLVRTHSVLSHGFARLFREHGLSEPQYNALRIIAAAGAEGIRSETVGERMVAHDPDTTRLIDRLVHAGLVERHRFAGDRRCVLAVVTSDGRKLLRRLHRKVAQLHEEQLNHLSRRDLDSLNKLLFKARHT